MPLVMKRFCYDNDERLKAYWILRARTRAQIPVEQAELVLWVEEAPGSLEVEETQ